MDQQLSKINLLFELSRSFSTAPDLPALLNRTVEASAALVDADFCSLILRDLETRQPVLRARTPAHHLNDRPIDTPDEDPLVTYTITQQQPLPYPNTTPPDDLPAPLPTGQAGIYVPLISKAQSIGVIHVQKLSGTFTLQDIQMLTGLAGYAAIAIENTQLYRQAMDGARELRLLVESANALSWSLDLSQVLETITTQVMRSLHTHWVIVSRWNKDTRTIVHLAERSQATWHRTGAILDLDTMPFHQHALEQGRPLAVSRSDDPYRETLDTLGYSRALSLPIQREGRLVGLVELANIHKPEPFSTGHVRSSIQHAVALAEVLTTRSHEHSRSLFQERLNALRRMVKADWSILYLNHQPDQHLRRQAVRGQVIWTGQQTQTLPVDDYPTFNVILTEQRVAVMRPTDDRLVPSERQLFNRIGDGALLVLPLVSKTATVGLVQLYDLDADRQFTPREIALARALANQAAVALDNADLVRDLQESLDAQQAMQSHLVRAARLSALGEMATVIAHQINNPLTTIIGDAGILTEDIPTNDPTYESAHAILRAGERAKRVVERMLNMARYEEGTEPIQIAQTIKDTLELVGAQITENSVQLSVELSEDLPLVNAIPGQLEDVWMNLLMNARDAAMRLVDRTRVVSISAKPQDNGKLIEVVVEDNGDGIPPETLTRVFDPMFTTKPRGKGTGLGLYICHQIVTDHDGQIKITSTPGTGTQVVVTLPGLTTEDKLWQSS